ncbi:MAG: 16S rRNA (guanine(527)-N(7))-methyltransferase RsmG [Pyrinomonadaceae bacterium]
MSDRNEAQVEKFTRELRVRAPRYILRNDLQNNPQIAEKTITGLGEYYRLLLKWNDRARLVASVSAEEFATRHVLESMVALSFIPQAAEVIDVGSGGGLPIIPCLIARPDMQATLIESSAKKAVFLREVIRDLNRCDLQIKARVINARFEEIKPLEVSIDGQILTCRALERFEHMLGLLISKFAPACGVKKMLLFGGDNLKQKLRGLNSYEFLIPESERRYLFVVTVSAARP